MEFRYVYRRIEDAIGTQFKSKGNPHDRIALNLRLNYREERDTAISSGVRALCTSSMAGNSSIDVVKISDTIYGLTDQILASIFPYIKKKQVENSAPQSLIERGLALLAEIEKKKKENENKETKESEDTEYTDIGSSD